MTSLLGSITNAGFKIATTWGTAVQAATGGKLVAQISPNFNVQELISRQVGSGNAMVNYVTKGSVKPTIQIQGEAGYRNFVPYFMAQFFGTNTASAEITIGQGDYTQTMTFNTSLNSKYITVAFEAASADVMEFPTCAVRSFTLKTTTIPGYLDFSCELLASNYVYSGTVNTNISLASATLADTELCAANTDDSFWINGNGSGALSSSNQVNVESWELTLTRPQELVGEIRGAAGWGTPVSTGLFEGTLKLVIREQQDLSTFTSGWDTETTSKCKMIVSGTQIGSGSNKSYAISIPKMQLIKEPQYLLTEPGLNKLSLEYRIIKASSTPTGMSSTYPYVVVTNTLSTSLLA